MELIPTDELSEDKKSAIASIKQGKYGISVESYDRVKALELLGRHLGMSSAAWKYLVWKEENPNLMI